MRLNWKIIASVLAVSIGIGGTALYYGTHIQVNDKYYPKYAETLDVREEALSPEEYDELQAALPECELLWELPFQGNLLPLDTQQIAVTSLSQEEIALLDYLPALQSVDAHGCRDYDNLLLLIQQRPDLAVTYDLDFVQAENLQTTLSITNGSIDNLPKAFAHMPKLQSIVFSGKLPAENELDAIRQERPNLALFYQLGGQDFPLNSGTTQIDARDLGLSQDELQKTADENPQLALLWNIEILGNTFQTDVEELDFSDQQIPDPTPIEEALPYLYNLKKVVMCRCGLDSETMDALNKRHDDVRFVWEVKLGYLTLRTDATVFAPVINKGFVRSSDLKDFKYCTDIMCLDLGHMGISEISWAEYMPDLTYVVLADTALSDISPLANHEKLRFLEIFMTGVRDFSPLVSCPNLEDLNVSYCPGDPDALYEMTWLKHLWWPCIYNIVDDEGVDYRKGLVAHLPDTDVEWWNGSSTGGEWRHLDNYYAMRDAMGMPYFFG